jgi:hypothetical protein
VRIEGALCKNRFISGINEYQGKLSFENREERIKKYFFPFAHTYLIIKHILQNGCSEVRPYSSACFYLISGNV